MPVQSTLEAIDTVRQYEEEEKQICIQYDTSDIFDRFQTMSAIQTLLIHRVIINRIIFGRPGFRAQLTCYYRKSISQAIFDRL